MEIYLIRHTSVSVPAGYACGQTDVSLQTSFEDEATDVKEKLDGLTFDKVWTSPLSRCIKLASFCGYPDAVHDDRIKEINFGDWEMKSWNEISADPRSAAWFNDWLHTKMPNGECFSDQYQRVSDFLDEIRKTGLNRVCVFAHGGVLTCARVYAGEYTLEEAFKNISSYGAMIKIELD